MNLPGWDADDRRTECSLVESNIRIGGLRIDTIPMEVAVGLLMGEHRPATTHLCNAYTIALASKEEQYRVMLNNSTLNLADGMSVVWVARHRGHHELKARVPGPDLMQRCLEESGTTGLKHYLYGSTPEVLDLLKRQIDKRWPGACVVGLESPPFRELSDDEIKKAGSRIDRSGADLVWVGLGTPKQDFELERLARSSSAAFVAVGAAFDFIAGTKRRAPSWMQRAGLEWLFRLATEPRRLWSRYLIGNARFIYLAVRGK